MNLKKITATNANQNWELNINFKEGVKMKGTVKFFNIQKGFGFIAGEDGNEYFVHKSGLAEGMTLNDNDSVEFEVTQGDRGPKAVNVSKSGSGSASKSDDDGESESE